MDKKLSGMVELSAKGSLVLMIGRITSTVIMAIGTIAIARFLGPKYYGVITIATVPVNLALLLLNNGVDNAVINFLADNRFRDKLEELGSIVFTGFLINLSIGFATTIIIYVSAGFLSANVFNEAGLEPIIRIMSLSIFAQSMVNTSIAVFAGFEKMRLRSLFLVLQALLKTLVGSYLVYMSYGVIGAAIGFTAPTIIVGFSSALLTVFSLRKIQSSSTSLFPLFSRFLKYSYPLFASNLLMGVLTHVFNFILPLYVNASEMGNYSAALNFSSLIIFFTLPLNTAFFPLFSKLNPKDDLFKMVFHNIIKYEAMVIYPITCLIIALSDQVVLLLYGKNFELASYFLKLSMLRFFLIGFGNSVAPYLISSQKDTEEVLRSRLIYILVGAPLGLYLLPQTGVVSVLVSQIIAPVFSLSYMLWWMSKKYELSINYKSSLQILVSSLMGLLGVRALSRVLNCNLWIELFLSSATYLLIYSSALPLSGSLKASDLDDIAHLMRSNPSLSQLSEPILNILRKLVRG